MPAFLENVGGGKYVLRAGPDAVAYGDDYTASGTVVTRFPRFLRWFGRGRCEIKGFTRREDDASNAATMLKDVRCCLREAGFSKWRFDRYRRAGVKFARIEDGLL